MLHVGMVATILLLETLQYKSKHVSLGREIWRWLLAEDGCLLIQGMNGGGVGGNSSCNLGSQRDHIMSFSYPRSAQTFHIPVMGTGFTIDTPLKVARYGISSVISLVDDHLTEDMRKFHSGLSGEPYEEIKTSSEDSRARRITAYLDLVNLLVERQGQMVCWGWILEN